MPIMGEAPELRDFFVACGFNGFGIASGGGAGKAISEWITDGQPSYDLSAADIRRFGPHHGSDRMVKALALDGQRRHYALARPGDEARMARMLRRSPVHAALAAAGAHFSPVIGWEIADYYGLEDGRGGNDAVNAEYMAAKQTAILVDDSHRAKIAVMGPDAEAALQKLCTGFNGSVADQAATSLILNATGGIDCDVTISELRAQVFLLTTPASRSTHLQTCIRHGLAGLSGVETLDVTAGSAVFVLSGPSATQILAPLFEGELDGPERSIRDGYLAGVPARVIAMTPYGEQGFEIHVSSEYAAHVFESLRETGADQGLRLAGTRAVELLRIENGIPAFGREIRSRTTPPEIAAVNGKTADRVLKRFFLKDGAFRPKGREGLLCGDERVGIVTSAAFSPLAKGSFLLASVDQAFADAKLDIETRDGKTAILDFSELPSER